VVALSEGSQRDGSLVGRVRDLLASFNEETGLPAESVCLSSRWRCGEESVVAGELEEIENRLSRLKVSFPDLDGVEVGPLFPSARAYFASEYQRPADHEGPLPSTGFSRGMAG
jgi:hypothetical protein